MYSLPKSKNVDLKSATGVKNEFAKLTIVSTLNENKSIFVEKTMKLN